MKAGDKVALAQIGADLPNGLKIAKSKIRGVESNGMLCSEAGAEARGYFRRHFILPPSTPISGVLSRKFSAATTRFSLSNSPRIAAIASVISEWLAKWRRLSGKTRSVPKAPISIRSARRSPSSLNAGDAAPQFYGCYDRRRENRSVAGLGGEAPRSGGIALDQ